MQVFDFAYFFPLQNRSVIVYFKFCCNIFGCDAVIVLIWQKQGLPSAFAFWLFCLCLIHDNTFLSLYLFQDYWISGCVLRWTGEFIPLKATHLSCHCFFSFQAYLFHPPIYCIGTWAFMRIQGRKCEDGKVGHEVRTFASGKHDQGTSPHPTDILQAMLLLNCALNHQNSEVRNTGLRTSNLFFLLVIPQFIWLFY